MTLIDATERLASRGRPAQAPILEVEDLRVAFDIRPRNAWPWTPSRQLHAVGGISFDLRPGEVLGVVGESGSGKSTLARAIVGTVPSTGRVRFEGRDLVSMTAEERRVHRRDIQMIFQDPLAALNPRMTVGDIIAEPLLTHFPKTPRAEVRKRVGDLMERVGLLRNLQNRYPHEFSGGQCQRIGIARALILRPKLLICDEPVSALDVSVQAQVVNLLRELRREMGIAMIFIAHDLSVVRHLSDRVAVMYLGKIVEIGTDTQIYEQPTHPYTQALLSAAPGLRRLTERIVLQGESPSALNPPSGCSFRLRCPRAQARCEKDDPLLAPVWSGGSQLAACHFPGELTIEERTK